MNNSIPAWVDRQGALEYFQLGKDMLQAWEVERWIRVFSASDKSKKRYKSEDLDKVMTALAEGQKPRRIGKR